MLEPVIGRRVRSLPRKILQMGQLAINALGWTRDVPIGGPLHAQISISDPCNHRCVMCGYHPPSEASPPLGQFGSVQPGLISFEAFRRLIDELRALGTRQIDLIGRGEPLLHPHAGDMIRYAKEAGFTVTLATNGSPLDGTMARTLVEAHLDRIRVSLNAGVADTYPHIHVNQTAAAYHSVRANVRQLCQLRGELGAELHVSLGFVVNAINFAELVEMVEAAHEVGANAARFQHNVHMADTENLSLSGSQYARLTDELIPAALARAVVLGVETDLAALASTPPAHLSQAIPPCYIGHYFAIVLGNGNVMACCQTQRSLGSIHDGGFTRVWRGDAYRRFRAAARRLPAPDSELETYECDRCFFRTHNVTVHNVLHPWSRIPHAEGEKPIPIADFISLSRSRRT